MTTPAKSAPPAMDISSPRRVHVLGVAGPGMSAVAVLLARMGHLVTGCDRRDTGTLATVRRFGVDASVGHATDHLEGVEYVVYPTGFPVDHAEMTRAAELGLPTLHRSAALRAVSAAHRSVGVLGTHGKTTTTSLLTAILRAAGRDPSFCIGAEVPQWGTGADAGSDGTLVIECDESDDSASSVVLRSAIITNIDADHLDRYGDIAGVEAEYSRIISGVPGAVVVCGDDARALRIVRAAAPGTVITYGFGTGNDVVVGEPVQTPTGISFTLTANDRAVSVSLPLRGRHNALNCAAAVVMAAEMGVDVEASAAGVADFGGVERRFTEAAQVNDALVIDDYAHLPAEIEAVLAAAAEHPRRSGRVIAVFQPNRYHRVQSMAGEYAGCFGVADRVYVTDIYASGTEPIPGVTGMLVVDAVRTEHPDVVWAESRGELVDALLADLGSGDICVSMGCGDIGDLPRQLSEGRE